MRPPRQTPVFFPPPSELAWYGILRVFRRWAEDLPEEEMLKRTERLSAAVASVCGRAPEPFIAMGRGLAQTVYCRAHRIRVLDRLDGASRVRWEKFREEACGIGRAIFVSAHMGPFQLQMDLLADLPQHILFIYRSYRWAPLARQVALLRLKTDRFEYADSRNPTEIAKILSNGRSLAFLGDLGEDFSVRTAIRYNLPLFVGGLYNLPQSRPAKSAFGLDYERIEPAGRESTSRAYSAAMERLIRRNPSDWVFFKT